MDERVIIGVDVGGTKIAAGAVSVSGETFASQLGPTEAGAGAEAVLDRMADMVAAVVRQARDARARVMGVAVATPGVVERESGAVRFATPALPGWTGADLGERLAALTGMPIAVVNDAHAAAWGEWRAGAGLGTRDMTFVSLGTGIGGGIVADGRLLLGHEGAAARIGHLSVDLDGVACHCGGRGCVEQYASGRAIERAAAAALATARATSLRTRASAPSAADVIAAARHGDDVAREILAEATRHLGAALATLVNLLNPEVIVLGGGLGAAGDVILAPAAASMARRLPDVLASSASLRPAALGGRSAVVGAALLAWERWGSA